MALKLSWYEPPSKVIHKEEYFALQQQINRANYKIKEARELIEKPILPVLAEIPTIFPQVFPDDDPELDAIEETLNRMETQFPWMSKGADDGEGKL